MLLTPLGFRLGKRVWAVLLEDLVLLQEGPEDGRENHHEAASLIFVEEGQIDVAFDVCNCVALVALVGDSGDCTKIMVAWLVDHLPLAILGRIPDADICRQLPIVDEVPGEDDFSQQFIEFRMHVLVLPNG